MDRFSLDLLINPCSMACSSPFTITPCACCHPAVLCLQSYSVHLSDTIYGKQFVVYHGSCSFLRTFSPLFFWYLLHIRHGCFWPGVKIEYQVCDLFCVQINWRITSPLFRVLSSKKCVVTKLKTRLFFFVPESLEAHGFLWTETLVGLRWAVTSFVRYNKRKWMHSN